MRWPSTYASSVNAVCHIAKPRTIGAASINVSSARRHQPITNASINAKMEVVSAPKPNVKPIQNQIRDFREMDETKRTYRCSKAWQKWSTQADCNFSVKNPDHDKCWFLTLQGECNRED